MLAMGYTYFHSPSSQEAEEKNKFKFSLGSKACMTWPWGGRGGVYKIDRM